ncbi:MAG TPA: hypothetical protein VM120_09500, partial [Bryobacteraceae bacterium]|nr:hypothetical protein [Bryobacteraceae bacterium]
MAENHHFDSKPPWLRSPLAIPGLLLLLTIGFYWKLTLSTQYTWFDHPDMAYLEIPRLEFQAREIHKGHFPLWDPRIWAGQPLIGQTQPGPIFPLNVLFALLPLNNGYLKFAYLKWYWVLIHYLAAVFAYWLARDLRLSRAAGILCGVAFSFGGFVGTVAWLDVVNGAIWAPLVFLFLLRASRGERPVASAGLGGLFLGIAWLSGHHELPILLSLASVFTWLWWCWRNRGLIPAAVTFCVVTGMIAAAQALPTYEFGRLSVRWIGLENTVGWKDKIPYTVHTLYSLPPKGLLATFLPGFQRFADASPFMGVIAVGFALQGIAARWREATVRLATALLCGSAVYALGVFTPVQGVLYSLLPVVDKARIPGRAVLVLNFALALLAAYGFDAVLSDGRAPWTRRLRYTLLALGILLLAASIWLVVTGQVVDDRTVLAGLVALTAAALLGAWQRPVVSRAVVFGGLLSLSMIELTQAGPALYSNRYDKDSGKFTSALTQHHDIAAYLRALKQGPLRVVVDDHVIGANFGDWHDIDMLQGYVAGVSANLTLHELHTQRTQDLFGVTHFIGTKADKPDQQEVFTGASGVKVFRSASPLPRVRAVHDARVVESADRLRMRIQDPAVDLRQTALFLKEAPQLEQCSGEDSVRVTSHGTDEIAMDVTLPCRGLIILAETMYPGWETTVDSRLVPTWEAYGVFRSAVVEGGTHRIRMRFRPKSVYAGAGLSLAGLLLVVVLCRLRESSTFRTSTPPNLNRA